MNFKNMLEKNKETLLQDTIELLKIPSVLEDAVGDAPFGEPIKEALHHMLNKAKNDGFKVVNVDNHAGHIEFGEGDEILGIICHLDVVPVNEKLWDTKPFEPTIKNEKIYARGAMDDKGPIMAAYYALKFIKDSNIIPNKKIRIILGCDEENAWRGIKKYFEQEEKPTIAFSPDADFPLIYGEKGIYNFNICGDLANSDIISLNSGTRFNVIPDTAIIELKNNNLENKFKHYLNENNYKGEYSLKNEVETLTVYGKSGHGSMPEVGLNAGYIIFDFLKDILIEDKLVQFFKNNILWDLNGEKLKIDFKQENWGECSNNLGIYKIENNKFKLSFNFRFPIDYNFEKNKDTLLKLTESNNYKLEETDKLSKPHYVPLDDELVTTLMASYVKITNDTKNKPFTIGGGTYSRAVEKCVAFGPSKPLRDGAIHQPNENLELEELYNATLIYADAIYNLTK